MNTIGDMFYEGTVTEENHEEAFKWYLLSAQNGYKWGMYNAGILLCDGDGTEKDEKAGYEWISKAADAGVKAAINYIKNYF